MTDKIFVLCDEKKFHFEPKILEDINIPEFDDFYHKFKKKFYKHFN